jgi:hypothetical protein
MVIWTLKDVIPVMLEDTDSVIVAAVDCPDVRVVPLLFQVIVSGPLALVGFQLLAAMLSVKEDPPVFLT